MVKGLARKLTSGSASSAPLVEPPGYPDMKSCRMRG